MNDELRALEERNERINIGVVGAHTAGEDIVRQISVMKGVKTGIISDPVLNRVVSIYRSIGLRESQIVITSNERTAEEALKEGKSVASNNMYLAAEVPTVDVIIDAIEPTHSGCTEVGANVELRAVTSRKHVITVNKSVDAMIGPILRKFADASDIVYSGPAGEEIGGLKELYDLVDALGFDVVAAGKGKCTPLNREATPDSLSDKASKLGIEAKILVSYEDGTNSMFEMNEFANATGLKPDIRGMHGPTTTISELPKAFNLKEQGGILQDTGVVDYALGPEFPYTVFLVFTGDKEKLKDYSYFVHDMLGPGPNYAIIKSGRMHTLEIPLSAARAVIYGKPTVAPLKPVAEVITVAKRNIKAGETLDGVGGSTTYGLLEKLEVAREEEALPAGLSEGLKLKKDVSKGDVIRYSDVELDGELTVLQLKKLQDKLFTHN